jgi:glycine dehydrogenase subunit 1
MLKELGLTSAEELFATVPENARLKRPLKVEGPLSEPDLKRYFLSTANANVNLEDWICFRGGGVYDHYIPSVVTHILQRSEFYTSYTPYQAEISQGFLQTIYEYQTMVSRLTGMEVSNASLYDAATALAEAVFMAFSIKKRFGPVAVSDAVNPFYRRVLRTYLRSANGALYELPHDPEKGQTEFSTPEGEGPPVAVICQQPNFFGCLEDLAAQRRFCDATGAIMVTCVDPVALGLLRPPGEYGADIVVAEGQGLGCGMNFGGPLLGIMATRREHIRHLPGRIAGLTTDAEGKRAFALTLQTREQHIKREKATSNICTNQALCALAACVYLSTLGEVGFRQIAEACLQKSHYAMERLSNISGFQPCFPEASFFKEFALKSPIPSAILQERLGEKHILAGLPLGRYYSDMEEAVLWCITEKRTKEEIDLVVQLLADASEGKSSL